MRCGLEITCHLMKWFWALPWWVHWGLLVCLILALWGIGARLWSVAKAFGGWQAGVAAIGAASLLLAALWPRRGKPVDTDEIYPHPDKPKAKKKPSKPWLRQPGETVSDWWDRMDEDKR